MSTASHDAPGSLPAGRFTAARLIAGQLLRFALLLVAVSVVAFALVALSPIDPVQINVGSVAYQTMGEAKRAQIAEYWGTSLPLWRRYMNWATRALQGDFGMSLRYNAPVGQVIASRFVSSAALMASAWVASGALGLALGIWAALRQGGITDRVIRGYCYTLASTPSFWLALVLLTIMAVWLKLLPMGFSKPIGVATADVSLLDWLRHLALPALTLSLLGIPNIALHTREKTIDVMDSEYVRLARVRGESTASIVWRHGLRNLALPALTLHLASISEVFGGSVLIEQVFTYPGLGQAAVAAGLGGDASLLVAISLLSAAIVFAGNLAANLSYRLIDPRLRLGALEANRRPPAWLTPPSPPSPEASDA